MADDVTGELGKRERQIMEIIFRRGSATAAEVLADLPDRPSYSSVRGMLRYLEGKGLLHHNREGLRYVYSPTSSKGEVRQSVLSNVVRNFFDDSVSSAVATLLQSKRLTDAEYEQLKSLLDKLPKEDER